MVLLKELSKKRSKKAQDDPKQGGMKLDQTKSFKIRFVSLYHLECSESSQAPQIAKMTNPPVNYQSTLEYEAKKSRHRKVGGAKPPL